MRIRGFFRRRAAELAAGLTALLCAAAAAACLAAYRRMAYRCFGGVTGGVFSADSLWNSRKNA